MHQVVNLVLVFFFKYPVLAFLISSVVSLHFILNAVYEMFLRLAFLKRCFLCLISIFMREFIHSFSFGRTVFISFGMLCLAASIILSSIVTVIYRLYLTTKKPVPSLFS